MAEDKHWEEGMKTHENIIFSCFGGMSNTGITSALASMEAVKELGLEKVAIGCLGALPLGVKPVIGKTKAAKKSLLWTAVPLNAPGRPLSSPVSLQPKVLSWSET